MALELRLGGYVSTNCAILAREGLTTNYTVKLVSERYLEAMNQAREALDKGQFAQSQQFVAVALVNQPDDSAAIQLQNEVARAAAKAEAAMRQDRYLEAMNQAREAFDRGQFAQSQQSVAAALVNHPGDSAAIQLQNEVAKAVAKAEEAMRVEQANAKARELASLPWLEFQRVISDCTDTRQVQNPVQMVDVRYETYRDSDGKYKQRKVQGPPHTVMQTSTESSFNPAKFSAQYAGRTFRFNCPDKWSVSKVEKDGAIKFTGERSGNLGLSFHTICASPPANNRDAFKSIQKGQKIAVKGVISKYTGGFVGPTLYMENAELVSQ
jgi:hypothetical protein